MVNRRFVLCVLGVGTVFSLYVVSQRKRTATWKFQTADELLSNQVLLQKIKALPPSYDRAIDFYESLGYKPCPKKSEVQIRNKLWMHLRAPASEPACAAYFNEFLATYKLKPNWPPPKEFPQTLKDRYLLYGRSLPAYWYFAQRYEGAIIPKIWSPDVVRPYLEKANLSGLFTYGTDAHFLYKVVQDYPLNGQKGLVIGSESPWVEAILLARGKADKVITLEYYPINSTHPHIEYVSPVDFSKSWTSFAERNLDFAFTFSSLEHTGLGRYGDRLDPEGDLTELRKLSCVLPDKAMVFLGIPMGTDTVYWNAHRIYGIWRLPLMTANYDVIAVYQNARIEDAFTFANTTGYKHAIIVMRNAKSGDNLC